MIDLREQSLVRALGLTYAVAVDAGGFGAAQGNARVLFSARRAEYNISNLMALAREWITESELGDFSRLHAKDGAPIYGGMEEVLSGIEASICEFSSYASEGENEPSLLGRLVRKLGGELRALHEGRLSPDAVMQSFHVQEQRHHLGWWVESRFGGEWEAGAGTPGEVIQGDCDRGEYWIWRLANALLGDLWFYSLERDCRAMAALIATIREFPVARILSLRGWSWDRLAERSCRVGGNLARFCGTSGYECVWFVSDFRGPSVLSEVMEIVAKGAEEREDPVIFALARLGEEVASAMERVPFEAEENLVAEIREKAAELGAAPWLRAAVSHPTWRFEGSDR